jgi:hypothetical protein
MCKDNDRLAGGAPGEIVLQPGKLVGPERAQTACLEMHHIHQRHEMNAPCIEAVITAIV